MYDGLALNLVNKQRVGKKFWTWRWNFLTRQFLTSVRAVCNLIRLLYLAQRKRNRVCETGSPQKAVVARLKHFMLLDCFKGFATTKLVKTAFARFCLLRPCFMSSDLQKAPYNANLALPVVNSIIQDFSARIVMREIVSPCHLLNCRSKVS